MLLLSDPRRKLSPNRHEGLAGVAWAGRQQPIVPAARARRRGRRASPSGLEQDAQALRVGNRGARLQLGPRAAADRVLHQQERVCGETQHPRDVLRRHLEGLGDEDERPLAELLECDAVVQTAR